MDDQKDLFDALNYPPDSDDPPEKETPMDVWWGIFNRNCESMMRWLRIIGLL